MWLGTGRVCGAGESMISGRCEEGVSGAGLFLRGRFKTLLALRVNTCTSHPREVYGGLSQGVDD